MSNLFIIKVLIDYKIILLAIHAKNTNFDTSTIPQTTYLEANMSKKLIKRILLGIVSIFLILVGILAVHIYQVTRPSGIPLDNRVLQKVWFDSTMTQNDKIAVMNDVRSMENIREVKPCDDSTCMIYIFPTGKFDNQKFKESYLETNSMLTLHVPNLENACPVDQNSVSYKIGVFFQNLFS